ncbi:MAG TPA: hypothetical protein VLR90_21515 [Blastocatellia bacterium]|nr:hypothetical protein [Blastocatellia bacterium]
MHEQVGAGLVPARMVRSTMIDHRLSAIRAGTSPRRAKRIMRHRPYT